MAAIANTKEINKALIAKLRTDLDAAMAKVAKKYGMVINCGAASYDESSVVFKVTAALGDAQTGRNAQAVKAAADWAKYHVSYGFKKAWLGKTILVNGNKATIIGLMPSRPRFPVLVEYEGGKGGLVTADVVIRKLSK